MTTTATAKALKESNDAALAAWDKEIEKFEALVQTYAADTKTLKSLANNQGAN